MTVSKIKIPKKLDVKNTFAFVELLFKAPKADEYVLDFSSLKWVEPFPLLYLSCAIAQFGIMMEENGDNPKVGVESIENNACRYASHMGFFKSFRVNYGNSPGEANNNLNYIPITIINIQELKEKAKENREHVGEVIEKRAEEFAVVLTREKEGDLVDTLKFTLREMMRNVVEHSEAMQIGFCAQYWPSKYTVELAILDTGRGLKESLSNNPFLDKDMDDMAAVNYALLPGISGTMYKGKYSDPYDDWQNSGYGLFMASEICRNGGDFLICSDYAGMKLEEKDKTYYLSPMPATAIRLRLNTRTLKPTKLSLKEYRKKGERVAKEIYGANLSASAASSMLTRDFIDSD